MSRLPERARMGLERTSTGSRPSWVRHRRTSAHAPVGPAAVRNALLRGPSRSGSTRRRPGSADGLRRTPPPAPWPLPPRRCGSVPELPGRGSGCPQAFLDGAGSEPPARLPGTWVGTGHSSASRPNPEAASGMLHPPDTGRHQSRFLHHFRPGSKRISRPRFRRGGSDPSAANLSPRGSRGRVSRHIVHIHGFFSAGCRRSPLARAGSRP